MFKFSTRSKSILSTCDQRLQQLFNAVLDLGVMDATVTEGRRSRETQQKYFEGGFSKVQWPNSKHNVLNPTDLSKAVDVVPCINGKISWEKEHCIFLAGLVMAMAKQLGVGIRWGGNWDGDAEPITDQGFQDLVHYELTGG
jgi:peptidoglycan L-alanyl-D-glutamate endopeptidase CwlK